jgi:hypothetical protein
MGKAIIMRNCFKKIFNLVKHFSFNYIYILLKTNLKEAELIAYWGFVIVVVNGLCYLFLWCIFKDDGGAWLSNFGQSFGFASAILAFLSILLILKNIRDQNVESSKIDTQQEKKLKTLKNQAIITAELASLDVFIKANRDLNSFDEKEVDLQTDLINTKNEELVKVNDENKKEKIKKDIDELLKQKNDLLEEIRRKYLKRSIYIKNTIEAISEKYNSLKSSINNTDDEESVERNNLSSWKDNENKIIHKISEFEGVPACAIISENLLNLLQSKNPEDRQKLLKVHKCYFAKWINDIFRFNKEEAIEYKGEKIKYTIDDIINDIEHFYEVDRIFPSKGVDNIDKQIYRNISIWCLEKTKDYTLDLFRKDGKENYISTPFFHKRQISQLSNLEVFPEAISDLEKIQWKGVENEKYVLSSLQYKLYGCELYDIISKIQNSKMKRLRKLS